MSTVCLILNSVYLVLSLYILQGHIVTSLTYTGVFREALADTQIIIPALSKEIQQN